MKPKGRRAGEKPETAFQLYHLFLSAHLHFLQRPASFQETRRAKVFYFRMRNVQRLGKSLQAFLEFRVGRFSPHFPASQW